MTDKEKSTSIEQLTQQIALKEDLKPTDEVFRYLHPIMVCGIENGQLLLRGTRSNATVVTDNYNRESLRLPANKLPEPGLNFTKNFHPKYKNDARRLAVSLKMKDQPEGLKIYPDHGSEASAVYFTLPTDSFFKVDLKEGNIFEIAIAIKIHQLMEGLPMSDEPEFAKWTNLGKGNKVVSYLQNRENEEQRVDVLFIEETDGYHIQIDPHTISFLTAEQKKILERMSVYCWFLENKDFSVVIGMDNTRYTKTDLIVSVEKSSEFKQLRDIEKKKESRDNFGPKTVLSFISKLLNRHSREDGNL